ncbi:MAG: hypothetical protein M3R65_03330 [Gemmatimonadota bacterium]|nr:hypothetical protein [Gemmatimonadota bacterium]
MPRHLRYSGYSFVKFAFTVASATAVLATAGCASGGAPAGGEMAGVRSIETGESMGARMGSVPEFKSAQRATVQLGIADAWAQSAKAYASLGIPITIATPETHTIGNTGMRRTHTLGGERLSSFLECGAGSGGGLNADLYGVSMSVISQLRALSDGSTEIATMVQATATPLTFGSPAVTCSTSGVLEQKIAALVAGPTSAGR